MGAVLTLTGNSGGPVSPDGGGNINVVGGSNINTVGTLNTLTINVTGAVLSLHGDQGPITTASNVLVTTNDGVNGGTAFFISSTSQVQLVFSDLVQNTAIGSGSVQAGRGSQNSAFGASSLDSLTSGTNNTAIGFQAGNGIDNGDFNISIGAVSNTQLTSGSYNIAIGYLAGNLWGVGSSSSNIAISNAGVASESNVIRIGTTGSGNHQQNKCFIAGTYGITPGVSSPKPVIMDSSGQLGTITTTNHAVQIGNAGGNFSSISVGTNGQVLLGATGADPAFANLTSSGGTVTYTTGANALNLEVTSPSMAVVDVTGPTQAMAVNTIYIADDSVLITFTLPAVAAQGSRMRIVGNGSGGWTIVQNAGQSINVGASPSTPTTGSVSSSNQFDALELFCTVANTTFSVISSMGNLTIL